MAPAPNSYNTLKKRPEVVEGDHLLFQFPTPSPIASSPSHSNMNSSPLHTQTNSSFNTDKMLGRPKKYSSSNTMSNSADNSYRSQLHQIPAQFNQFITQSVSHHSLSNTRSHDFSEPSHALSHPVSQISQKRNSREISDSMQSQATIFSTRGLKTANKPTTKSKRIRKKIKKFLVKMLMIKPRKLFAKRKPSIIRNYTITNNLSREGSNKVTARKIVSSVSSRNLANQKISYRIRKEEQLAKYINQQNEKYANEKKLKQKSSFVFKDYDASEYSEQLANSFPSILGISNIKESEVSKSLSQQRRASKYGDYQTMDRSLPVHQEFVQQVQPQQQTYKQVKHTPQPQKRASKPKKPIETANDQKTNQRSKEMEEIISLWSQYLKHVVTRRIILRQEINQLTTSPPQIESQIINAASPSALTKRASVNSASNIGYVNGEEDIVANRNSILSRMLSQSSAESSSSSCYTFSSRRSQRSHRSVETATTDIGSENGCMVKAEYPDVVVDKNFGAGIKIKQEQITKQQVIQKIKREEMEQHHLKMRDSIRSHTQKQQETRVVKNENLLKQKKNQGLEKDIHTLVKGEESEKTIPVQIKHEEPPNVFIDSEDRNIHNENKENIQVKREAFFQEMGSSIKYQRELSEIEKLKQKRQSLISKKRIKEKEALKFNNHPTLPPQLKNQPSTSEFTAKNRLREIGKSSGSLNLRSYID